MRQGLSAVAVVAVFSSFGWAVHEELPLAQWEKTEPNEPRIMFDEAIEVEIGYTQIYQQNVKGGISTHSYKGRWTGSYDIELDGDLQKLLGLEGASFYMLIEGSYRDGINDPSIESFFGVNGDAAGNRSIDVTELWYQKTWLDGRLAVRAGKIDLTGGFECRGCPASFDGSLYANDETGQFLNNALINNPTIPFPDNGLAAVVYYNPFEWLYVSAAAADAQADARETGFRTAFHGADYFFYIAEAGIVNLTESENGPMVGAYRAGVWYDPQPKEYTDSKKSYRDDTGFYLTCDQQLFKENSNAEDSQGLGMFFRYGFAHSRTNDMVNFWSSGFQYQGLFEGRDDDVLGIGYAQGFFNDRTAAYTEDYESVVEAYYNVAVNEHLNISPSVQYVKNPGGDKTIYDAVVIGVRAQFIF